MEKAEKSNLRTVQCLLFFNHSAHQGLITYGTPSKFAQGCILTTGKLNFHFYVKNNYMKMESVGNSILFFSQKYSSYFYKKN